MVGAVPADRRTADTILEILVAAAETNRIVIADTTSVLLRRMLAVRRATPT